MPPFGQMGSQHASLVPPAAPALDLFERTGESEREEREGGKEERGGREEKKEEEREEGKGKRE